ncbi:ribonuclease HIII [Streptococcus pneumoniae]|nr:ribonuclease HIII [Streptococcus pneumoniae]
MIDAFTSAKNYDKYLAQEANRFSNPISLEEKAEGKYLSVLHFKNTEKAKKRLER